MVVSSDRLRMGVPIVGEAVAAQLGTGRAAALHVAFAETLARLEGVDPRESADHVRSWRSACPGRCRPAC